jgi:hypothetical protein
MRNKLLAALTALTLLAPIAAAAQDMPSYAQPAAPAVAQDEQIQGRIISFDGAYSLTVQDDRGFVDNVQLHDGTIINPTGLTLQPGMVVSILGYNAGNFFAANEVDTPYSFYAGVPYYAGWWHGGYFRGGYRYVGGARIYAGAPVRGVYANGSFRGRNYVAPASRGGYYAHAASRGGGRPPHRFR